MFGNIRFMHDTGRMLAKFIVFWTKNIFFCRFIQDLCNFISNSPLVINASFLKHVSTIVKSEIIANLKLFDVKGPEFLVKS